MKTFLAAAGLLAGVLGLSAPALAWNDAGQKTACYIAYAEMQPETRARVEALIPGGADAFADACTWAPDHWLKGGRRADSYINVPRDAEALTASDCPEAHRCLLSAVERDRAALVSAKTSDEDRVRALKLLGYWVGRLHQPLAVGFRSDLNGTMVNTAGLTYCKGSLQHLWADCMVDYAMMLKGAKDAAGFAAALTHSIDADARSQWRSGLTPATWASESLQIATKPAFGYCTQGDGGCRYQKNRLNFRLDTQVDGHFARQGRLMSENLVNRQLTASGQVISTDGGSQRPKPTVNIKTVKLDEVYIASFAPLVEVRLKQAGVRLAAVLDAAFTDTPAPGGGAASR